MNSLFLKIMLWLIGSLIVTFIGFMLTSVWISRTLPHHDFFIQRTLTGNFEVARQIYEDQGREALRKYLQKLDEIYESNHYFIDPEGRDLSDDSDRSQELALSQDNPWPPPRMHDGMVILNKTSADGRYQFLVRLKPPLKPNDLIGFYFWLIFVVIFFSYLLTMHVVRPLRWLRNAVERFGEGDLLVRVRSRRRDELGRLAQAFDRMADRIATLLTAERRLLQDVSHELRSPLARLEFALELARTAPDREKALARVRKETDRLAVLVNELLELTRSEGDPQARHQENIALHAMLQDLVEDCQLEANSKPCSLSMIIHDDAVIVGSPELTRRAVENIVRNAIKYTYEESKVEVHLRVVNENSAEIVVGDQGPGVPAGSEEAIFQPFYRIEADRARNSGGVGLGLAIARRAVLVQRGEIFARNRQSQDGSGLEVCIRYPLVKKSSVG